MKKIEVPAGKAQAVLFLVSILFIGLFCAVIGWSLHAALFLAGAAGSVATMVFMWN